MTDNDLYNKGGIFFERTTTQGRGSIHLANNLENNSNNVTKNDARLTINSSGNVGIGTTSPTEKLEVAGNAILDASNANLKIKAGVTGTKGDIQWTFNSDSTVYASAGITKSNITRGIV